MHGLRFGAMGNSDAPRKKHSRAYENLDFLNSPVARTIRVECEMIEPFYRLHPYGIKKTIVMFGSARTLPRADAKEALERERRKVEKLPISAKEKKSRIAVAEIALKNSRYYEDARKFARDMTLWSRERFKKPGDGFYICSGGGPGIMEAANRGAHEAGGKSIGLGINLPFEQETNPYVTPEFDFEFRYFFVRKYWFLYLAHALIAFPGGFGTMDELFEMLTLVQTGKSGKRVPIILYGKDFWEKIINFDLFKELGYISDADLKIFTICDSVDEMRETVIRKIAESEIITERVSEDGLQPHQLDPRCSRGFVKQRKPRK